MTVKQAGLVLARMTMVRRGASHAAKCGKWQASIAARMLYLAPIGAVLHALEGVGDIMAFSIIDTYCSHMCPQALRTITVQWMPLSQTYQLLPRLRGKLLSYGNEYEIRGY